MTQNEKSQIVRLIAGNLGMPGAPILHLELLYSPQGGTMNGSAEITQAIAPPNGQTIIPHVSGPIHFLGLGPSNNRVFNLSGQYTVSVQPPAIGTYLADFTATFVTDTHWKGHGTFTYGGHTIANVPIAPAE